MENNNYLNKSLKDAQEAMKIAKQQMDFINKAIPVLKSELIKHDPSLAEQIYEIEKVAKSGDLKKLLEIKNKLNANKG